MNNKKVRRGTVLEYTGYALIKVGACRMDYGEVLDVRGHAPRIGSLFRCACLTLKWRAY